MGSALVSVREVANTPDLWDRFAHGLIRANVFVDDASAGRALRNHWFGGGRVVPNETHAWVRGLSDAQRRLLVAWTWPNPTGRPAPEREVFEGVREELVRGAGDASQAWEDEVRARVSAVATMLDNEGGLEETGLLAAAAMRIVRKPDVPERVERLKVKGEPVVVDLLLDLSARIGLTFGAEPTHGGSWEYNAAGLERDRLSEGVLTLGTVMADAFADAEMALQPGLVSVDTSLRRSAELFHKELPEPPAVGKYVQLFEYLDEQTDTRQLTLAEIDEHIPVGRAPGSRGPAKPGLPSGARRPAFWANPRPGEHPALAKKSWARAWLAAGFTAHPVTEGYERTVSGVVFTPMTDRERWWRRRTALRASAGA